MISDKMAAEMNHHVQSEMTAAYLYLSMSAHFESQDLTGFSNWMKTQAQEELGHAMTFYQHILDRGGRVELQAMSAPKNTWGSILEVYEQALAHEKGVTKHIHELVDLAIADHDHASNTFLQWFVTEQVEEEATASQWVSRLTLCGDNPAGIFALDQEAGKKQMDKG